VKGKGVVETSEDSDDWETAFIYPRALACIKNLFGSHLFNSIFPVLSKCCNGNNQKPLPNKWKHCIE
jgi:hypothetical protein